MKKFTEQDWKNLADDYFDNFLIKSDSERENCAPETCQNCDCESFDDGNLLKFNTNNEDYVNDQSPENLKPVFYMIFDKNWQQPQGQKLSCFSSFTEAITELGHLFHLDSKTCFERKYRICTITPDFL